MILTGFRNHSKQSSLPSIWNQRL